ncbi:hypothetical protein FLACOL_02465 [Flavobacterium columnare]|uniref:Lipoprotein n=2 Tax=Flavobacterium TaxID=237 RepID=A0ABW8PSH0_9FLAO|nr:hypothetical protein [Flavobacterium columnare]SPE78449.1 hypothetical protein FLACOL_02465 [Flavobacterium columnare]
MANYIKILLVIFSILGCNQNKSTSEKINFKEPENNIKKIEITEFDSSPKDYNLFKYKCVLIERNSASFIEYTYQKGKLKNKEIIKSLSNLENVSKLFDNIPNPYLIEDKTFGNPNAVDDGGISVLVFLKNDKTIKWTLSYNDQVLPKEIKMLILEYKKIKVKLNV